jgi:DnaK suppressor protein
MDTYDRTQSTRFSQVLAQREAELRAVLRAVSDMAGHTSDVTEGEVVDFKDMAVEETQAVVENAKAEQAAVELEQVVAARRRLADGTYGECQDCGEEIDLRRLRALPATRFCTACQAIHEHVHALQSRRLDVQPQ